MPRPASLRFLALCWHSPDVPSALAPPCLLCSRRRHHLLPVRPASHDQVCLPAGEALACCRSHCLATLPASRSLPLHADGTAVAIPKPLCTHAFDSPLPPPTCAAEPGEAWIQARAVHPVLRQAPSLPHLSLLSNSSQRDARSLCMASQAPTLCSLCVDAPAHPPLLHIPRA